ncbi:MFS transporter [Rhodopila sp.]|uniref:MFS transporter n=1 Tax=Rhodopila sp. TaxID=2480087 RepID=UPI003D0F6F3F
MTGQSSAYRDLLHLPDLPALLTATLFSRLGGAMFTLTVVLYALTRFASPALAGWLALAAVAPGVAISPAAGALLDRIGPARAIAVDMAASAALVAAMIIADLSAAGATALFVLVAMFSLTSPLSAAGVRTLLPRLVPYHALDRANGLDTAIGAIAEVCGPALAGLLAGFAGPRTSLATIAATYGAAAIGVLAIRSRPRPPPGPGALLRQTVQGLHAVIGQPTLRGLAISYGFYQVACGMLLIAVPVALAAHLSTATRDLGAGLLWAIAGLGGGIGALLAGHLRTAGRERAVMAAGMIATALAACPLAALFGLTGLLLGLPLAGLVAGAVDVSLLTLRQRRTDPAELGRVMAVSISLNVAGFPLGSAIAGALVTHSVAATFAAAGIAAALGALAVRAIPAEG